MHQKRVSTWLLALAFVGAILQATHLPAEESIPSQSARASTSESGTFSERTLVDAAGSHRYVVYQPPGYTTERKWPVVLFLHGAGERGTDGMSPTYYGLGPILRHSPERYPCVVVFPQCETWDDRIFTSWSTTSPEGRRALSILDEVIRTESIDPASQSLTGWSMGGFGATALAAHDPGRWRAVLAVSGGFEGAHPEVLSQLPLWVIHGTRDSIVPVSQSQELARKLGLPQGQSRYDEVVAAGHEVWEQVYSRPEIAHWLLTGGTPPEVDWSIPVPAELLPTGKDKAPFIPAATMSRAVTLRVGNDALQMISAGIPEAIQADRLQGELPEIEQSFTIDGDTYELRLSDLQYAARLDSAVLEAQPTAEIRVDLGVKLELRIGEATLKTRDFSASTSPFRIVIGHRRPVPLSVLIQPEVRDQKLSLQHKETRFPIPDDNWYVEMPKDIQLSGDKFTRHEIETGIVGGLYTRKSDVEEQVRSVIPPLLERVEKRLNLDQPVETARWLWPFPVYQPRIRWVPEQLTVDIHGLTVQLGAVLGASQSVEPTRPNLHRDGTARLPVRSIHSRDLHVTVDPALMEVVSEEFSSAGVARINVLDLSEARFHAFADPQRMRKVLPSLPSDGELRTVLALSSPFQMRGEEGAEKLVRFTLPHAQLEVFSRSHSETAWSPAGRFSISVDQSIQIQLTPAAAGPPLLGLHWLESPECHVTAAEGAEKQAVADLERDVREAWIGWAKTQSTAPAPTEDFVVGDSRLRLDSLHLATHAIDLDLKSPLAQVTVTGTSPLRYRVRGSDTYWSLLRTLRPGETHRYEVTNPLEIQLFDARGEVYSIKPGEVVRWDESTGITFDPPRPLTKDAPPAVGTR